MQFRLLQHFNHKNTPVNCASATDSITVTASILANSESGSAVTGVASTPIANVTANDSVNGAAVVLGIGGNAAITPVGSYPSGISLSTLTGAITTTNAVAAGTYSVQYQLCDLNTPVNCATATDSITVGVATAVTANSQSGTAISGQASTPIANVAANGIVNGAAAVLGSGGNATVAAVGSYPAGIVLDTTTGAITTSATVPPGSYSLPYQLCDLNTPANCATATNTVTVMANIVANPQNGTAIAGTASTVIASVVTNDTVNGAAAILGSGGNATVAGVGSYPAGIVLNTNTGAITTTANVAPGIYTLQYQLCDLNTPVNCATATVTLTINAIIIASPEMGSAAFGVASTPITNVTANDTVNGVAATLGVGGNATAAPVGTYPTGIVLNAGTGAITTTTSVPLGTYNVEYQLCDRNTPLNCASGIATINVTTSSVIANSQNGTALAGVASTPIANVAANGSVNGGAATLGSSGNTIVSAVGVYPVGITLNTTTGAISVTANVAPGTYLLQYQLCDANNPSNCATAIATVYVLAQIIVNSQNVTAQAGIPSTPISNVVATDSVNGQNATLGAGGNATVSPSGSYPSGIALNTTTGAITVAATVPPAVYTLQYQLCDLNTPANCAVGSVTINLVINGLIKLEAQANVQQFSLPGTVIVYTFVVTNTGPNTLTNIILQNPQLGTVTCPLQSLNANQSMNCSANYITTLADAQSGGITMNSIVSALTSNSTLVSAFASLTISFDAALVIQKTQEAIRTYLKEKAALIMATQPDRQRIINRLSHQRVNCSGSPKGGFHPEENRVSFDMSLSSSELCADLNKLDVWAEVHGGYYRDPKWGITNTGQFTVSYVGIDYLATPSVVAGFLAEFDAVNQNGNAYAFSSAQGTGEMVGPYLSARVTEGVYLHTRAAWGYSFNRMNVFGLYQDNFNTNRSFYNAEFVGEWNRNQWRIAPTVGVSYYNETQNGFFNALNIYIPNQAISLGQVNMGPEIGYTFFTNQAHQVSSRFSIQGIYSFDADSPQPYDPYTFNGFSTRVKFGTEIKFRSGVSLSPMLQYDGLSMAGFTAFQGQVQINVPLY